jgi:RHS repeat-associated protein
VELTLVASSTLTITYGYDPLERLTAADYSDGSFFHYTYDAAGNRLSETTPSESNLYTYDDANRLANVNGVAYAWDANGNLLSDGANTYTYDGANRLTGVTDGGSAVSYAYNGLGDRLQTSASGQTTRYTLDLVSGLTQVLDDGGYTYLYGNGRIAQYGTSGGEYFLGDALGSVRQLADASGAVRLARSYQPYGELLASNGDGESVYGFTGEATDALTGMVYLRARWYAPQDGRFTSKDVWQGNSYRPLSQNGWNYVEGNPINFVDPSGYITKNEEDLADQILDKLKDKYEVLIHKDYGTINGGYGYCEKGWNPGAWRTINELQWIEEGIDKAVSVMGGAGNFKSAMQGQVMILRLGIPEIDFSVIPIIGPYIGSQPRGFAPPGGLIDVALPDQVFNKGEAYAEYTTAHELGHVWDRRTSLRLSNELMLYMGTLVCDGMGGCRFDVSAGKELPPGNIQENYASKNAMEDWAEAFASTIYPEYYGQAPKTEWRGIGPIREQFVRDQINELP